MFKKGLWRVGMLLAVLFVFAAAGAEAAGPSPERHPPICHEAVVHGFYEVKCADSGRDIVVAAVFVNQGSNYDFGWNESEMNLIVPIEPGVEVKWAVRDSMGSEAHGHFGMQTSP